MFHINNPDYLVQVKNKDEIFLEHFKKYEHILYRMSFLHLKNKEDALDAVQETAYRAYKSFDSVSDETYLKTWLIKININCAFDILRKKKDINYLEFDERLLPVQVIHDYSLRVSLKSLLENLNTDEKTIVFLKYYQEYSFREISEIINRPESTIKSILYRALRKLRELDKE